MEKKSLSGPSFFANSTSCGVVYRKISSELYKFIEMNTLSAQGGSWYLSPPSSMRTHIIHCSSADRRCRVGGTRTCPLSTRAAGPLSPRGTHFANANSRIRRQPTRNIKPGERRRSLTPFSSKTTTTTNKHDAHSLSSHAFETAASLVELPTLQHTHASSHI